MFPGRTSGTTANASPTWLKRPHATRSLPYSVITDPDPRLEADSPERGVILRVQTGHFAIMTLCPYDFW